MNQETKYYKIETSDSNGPSCAVKVQNEVITDLVDTTNRSKSAIAKGISSFKNYSTDLNEFEQEFDIDLSHTSWGTTIEDAPYSKRTAISEKQFEEVKRAHIIDEKIHDIHKKREKLSNRSKDPLEEKHAMLLGEVLEYSGDEKEAPKLVAYSVKERVEPTQGEKRLSREEIQHEHDEQAALRFKNLERYYAEKKQKG